MNQSALYTNETIELQDNRESAWDTNQTIALKKNSQNAPDTNYSETIELKGILRVHEILTKQSD